MQKIETGISELLKRQPVTEQEKDAYIQDLQKALRLLLEEVRDLEEMVALLQKKRFGSSSEATPVQEEEEPLGVFPEAELEYKEDAPEPFKKDQRGVHKISEAGRWKLTSSNETENRIFDLDEEERICPRCKGKLVWIGKELVREVFEYQRPKLKLVRYWQMSYKCPGLPQERPKCHCTGFRSKTVAESQSGRSFGGSRNHVPEVCECHAAVPAGSSLETAGGNIQPDYYGALDHPVRGRLAGASVERHAERASAKRSSACR